MRSDVRGISTGPSGARKSDTKFVPPVALQHQPQSAPVLRKSDLSPARQWLVGIMQEVGYGRIKHLVIVNGDPLVNPPPRLYLEKRFTGANPRRPKFFKDYFLKERVVKLLAEFDRIGNGAVAWLEVRDGLPYGMTLEEPRPGRNSKGPRALNL